MECLDYLLDGLDGFPETKPYHLCEPSSWCVDGGKGRRHLDCILIEDKFHPGSGEANCALVTDGTFQPGLSAKASTYHELAATLALIAGGYWWRYVAEYGVSTEETLNYVSWAEVKQQLCDYDRQELALLFDEYFAGRKYEAEFPGLVARITRESWGFDKEWDREALEREEPVVAEDAEDSEELLPVIAEQNKK